MSSTEERCYFTRSKLHDFKAAGVLPIALHNGCPYALIGAESCRTGPQGKVWKVMWRDFGGQREAIDTDSAATAGREFAEETLGLFAGCNVDPLCVSLSSQQMASQLRSKLNCLQIVHQLKKGEYHMYLAHTPFIDPVMFKLATQQNLQTHAVQGAEKSDFAWVRMTELMAAISNCSRQYHFSSRQRVWSSPLPPSSPKQSHRSFRLQIHPCFASSLRMAQLAGLDAFLAALSNPCASPSSHPPPAISATPRYPPSRPNLPYTDADPSLDPPSSDPGPATPSSHRTLSPGQDTGIRGTGDGAAGTENAGTQTRKRYRTCDVDQVDVSPDRGGGCSASTGGASCSRQTRHIRWGATGDPAAAAGGVERRGGVKGPSPEHMLYWLMQGDVAAQLVGGGAVTPRGLNDSINLGRPHVTVQQVTSVQEVPA